jgi:ethanolamine utilization protein EutJ
MQSAIQQARRSGENAVTISPSANQLLNSLEATLALNGGGSRKGEFEAGVDVGTAYIVTAVADGHGIPVAGANTRSRSSIRDGLVLDYMAAIRFLHEQVRAICKGGFAIQLDEAAYPMRTTGCGKRNHKAAVVATFQW